MSQVLKISATGKNGVAYPSNIVTCLPATGILIEAVSFPEYLPSGVANPLYGSIAQVTVLATSNVYYSTETASHLGDSCNAPLA